MKAPHLQIETINRCNAKCTFCLVPNMANKRSAMTDELFTRILFDAKDYGVKKIIPFLNGEPLLDPKFVQRIVEINTILPDAEVVFYSNGSLLSEEKAKELAKTKITVANFSINAVTNDARMKIMGVNLHDTIKNILYFKSLCPNVSINVSAIMGTTYWTPPEMQEFIAFWTKLGIKPNLFFEGNWAGKTRPVIHVSDVGCERPNDIMTILADGTVALCCYDLDGEVNFGNLNTQTIKEVWESEAMEHYRSLNDSGKRSELKMCQSCTTG